MLVGRIGRPHGLHGYLVVHPETDNPGRFAVGSVFVTTSQGPLTVAGRQGRPPRLLVRFDGFDDRTAAEALAGTDLFIEASARRPLDDDEFWPDELTGMTVRSETGEDLGVVADAIEGVGQYRLVISGPQGVFEVPFVTALVPAVDRETGVVTVAAVPGLVPGT